jgi:cytochrome c oxidase assembly protein subunit 15
VNRFARYSWWVLACNLAVILWGAFVRATGSGAGCGSHWPLCNGEILLRAPQAATIIEFAHRASSALALLLVLGLVIAAFRSRPSGHPARRGAVWSLFFILGEAALGAGLVLFELVAKNSSLQRALSMGAHLVNTFFLLAALALTAHWASSAGDVTLRKRKSGAGETWPRDLLLALCGLLTVGATGAVAALGDTLFPAQSLNQAWAQDVQPASNVLLRLRMLHPALALITAVLLLTAALRLRRQVKDPQVARYARWLTGLVLLQTVVGLANVALLAPIALQLGHLLLADLVWIAAVLLTVAAASRSRAGLALEVKASIPSGSGSAEDVSWAKS